MPPRRKTREAARETADQIVEIALKIADDEGLDALTMRRVASEMGIGTMTLYRHFDGKDELLDAMADVVLGRFATPRLDPRRPDEFLRDFAHELLNVMRAHPSAVRLITSRSTTTYESMLAGVERPLACFVEAGLTPDDAVRVYGLVVTYVIGFVSYQAPRPWGGPDDVPEVMEARRQQRLLHEALPQQLFPTIVRTSPTFTELPTRAQFDWGLEAIVAHVEGLVAPGAGAGARGNGKAAAAKPAARRRARRAPAGGA